MLELEPGELWEMLVHYELFTDSELELLTDINGFSVETLNDALYARYGYRDYNQMMSEYEEELEMEEIE